MAKADKVTAFSLKMAFLHADVTVSIILPCYNSARFLRQAIDSIIGQTYKEWELIAVDDGSTDDTFEILKLYSSKLGSRMTVLRQENRGAGSARNRGIAVANGAYVAFLDSDDLWQPDKLRLQVLTLKSSPWLIGLTTGYKFLRDSRGGELGVWTFSWKARDLQDWVWLGKSAPALCSTLLVKKSSLIEVGRFDEGFGSHAEDLDLAWRLHKIGTLVCLPDSLAGIRKSEAQGHSNTEEMVRSLRKFHQKNFEGQKEIFLRASKNLDAYMNIRLARKTPSERLVLRLMRIKPLDLLFFATFRIMSELIVTTRALAHGATRTGNRSLKIL